VEQRQNLPASPGSAANKGRWVDPLTVGCRRHEITGGKALALGMTQQLEQADCNPPSGFQNRWALGCSADSRAIRSAERRPSGPGRQAAFHACGAAGTAVR